MSRESLYRQRVRLSVRRWQEDRIAVNREIRALLRLSMDGIRSQLLSATEWDIYHGEQVMQGLEQTIRNLNDDMISAFRDQANRASTLALAGVDDPLVSMGFNASIYPHAPPVAHLNLISRVLPNQIVDITTEIQKSVQQVFQQVLMGGASTRDAIAKIGELVGPLDGPRGLMKPGQIMPRAEVRARTIFRTELNRVGNITARVRIDELAERDAGIGKQWLHFPSHAPRDNHAALHGTVVYPAKGEKFVVAGIKVDGPHDPMLPASEIVNCHCKVVAYYDPDAPGMDMDPILADQGAGLEDVR